jgi:hypothetical protein
MQRAMSDPFTTWMSEDDLYPSSDGQPMGETELHADEMTEVKLMLRRHFRAERDIGNISGARTAEPSVVPRARPALRVLAGRVRAVHAGTNNGPPRTIFGRIWFEDRGAR